MLAPIFNYVYFQPPYGWTSMTISICRFTFSPTYLLLGKTCNFFWIPSGPSAYIMAQILVYWLSKLANNLWYVNLYLLRPLQAWPQQKTQIYNKSKCLPEIRGLSCTQKTVIPMSPKILEHPSVSTEPFPKHVFERVFNEKLNSI